MEKKIEAAIQKIRGRVTLEPELELKVNSLSAWQRIDLAKMYEEEAKIKARWARQLRVSARIMFRDSCPKPPCRHLVALPEHVLRKN
jgi:hypothetical protein